MYTIKMANELGISVEMNPAQALSKGGHGKHFFPMTETGTICSLGDVFGSVTIDYSDAAGPQATAAYYDALGDSDEVGVAVRAIYHPLAPNPELALGIDSAWDAPGTDDVVITVCARARVAGVGESRPKVDNSCDPAGHNGRAAFTNTLYGYGGSISLYVGDLDDGTNSLIRLQPYYAVFAHDVSGAGSVDGQMSTPFYEPMKVREDGEIYIISAVKRGNYLEHYVNGVFTGRADITTQPAALQAAWTPLTFGRFIRFGHSAFGTATGTVGSFDPLPENPVGSSAICELEQDFYGMAISHFADAPPQSVISKGHEWMRREWPLNNKKIYPGWMAYA